MKTASLKTDGSKSQLAWKIGKMNLRFEENISKFSETLERTYIGEVHEISEMGKNSA